MAKKDKTNNFFTSTLAITLYIIICLLILLICFYLANPDIFKTAPKILPESP